MIALAEAYTIEKHGTLAEYLLRLQQLRQAGAREVLLQIRLAAIS